MSCYQIKFSLFGSLHCSEGGIKIFQIPLFLSFLSEILEVKIWNKTSAGLIESYLNMCACDFGLFEFAIRVRIYVCV